MGRFAHLVDSPASMERFRAKYHIPQGVSYGTMLGVNGLPIEGKRRSSFP